MSTLELKISETEKAISEKLEEADTISRLFVAEAATLLQGNYRSIAKAVGKAQPVVSQKLGKEGIAKLLAQIDGLIDRTPEICEKNLYKKSAWRHLSWGEENEGRYYHKRASNYIPGEPIEFQELSHHFYDCAVEFGDVLKRNGFDTGQRERGHGAYSDHEEIPHPSLATQFKWSDLMKELATKYKDISSELYDLGLKLESLKAEKTKLESDDLWSEIQ